MKHDDNNLSKALKFTKRCHEKYLNDKFVYEEPSKKRFRESGGGRKCKAPEVKEAIFEWFINLRRVLKGRDAPPSPLIIFYTNFKAPCLLEPPLPPFIRDHTVEF